MAEPAAAAPGAAAPAAAATSHIAIEMTGAAGGRRPSLVGIQVEREKSGQNIRIDLERKQSFQAYAQEIPVSWWRERAPCALNGAVVGPGHCVAGPT